MFESTLVNTIIVLAACVDLWAGSLQHSAVFSDSVSTQVQKPHDNSSNEAFVCCGGQVAYDYVKSVPDEMRQELLIMIKSASQADREALFHEFRLGQYAASDAYCKIQYDCNFTSERGRIDCDMEHDSIDLINKWIPPTANVLEIGARYGQASCYISKIVEQSGLLISVDPDPLVWRFWEENIQAHGCAARLVQGILGKEGTEATIVQQGYSTHVLLEDSLTGRRTGQTGTAKVHTLKSLQTEFDTMVIDCEGCFATILSDNAGLEQTLDLILAEVHTTAERAEVQRLLDAGWHLVDNPVVYVEQGPVLRSFVLSRAEIKSQNNPCLAHITPSHQAGFARYAN